MKIRMFNWTCFPVVSKPSPEIVIAYEDLATRLRVKQALKEVLGAQAESFNCKTAEWKFSLLEYPALFRQALEDAATADLIVISAHGKCDLPEGLKNWIGQWAHQKATSGGALVGVLDMAWKGQAGAEKIFAYLTTAAAAADFEWFPSFVDAPDAELNSHAEDDPILRSHSPRGRPRVYG